MHENLILRVFRLSPVRSSNGISCDVDGAFVGPVPLLQRIRPNPAAREQWFVRPLAELNERITALYGVPIDVAAKLGGIKTIARALDEGKIGLAKIATVQLQFPDPPHVEKTDSFASKVSLVAELYRSALLKADDDWKAKHPRTGTKPNGGWFASKPEVPKLPAKPGWPVKAVNTEIRGAVLKIAAKLAGGALLFSGPIGEALLVAAEIDNVMEGLKELFTIKELNGSEERLVAQMRANFDPPKTLEELRKTPTENIAGYERHHIVEQTDDNIRKDTFSDDDCLEKFGREKIDDPNNIVWVPRLKHELISAQYSSKPSDSKLTVREGLSQMDFAAQRQAGLDALRKVGVLK